ncbi:MAG TPA: hypothetical protein VLE96_05015 [Chlamydiales bacterium]|nr:hypothetical protein [Chlamydiales bacterium]
MIRSAFVLTCIFSNCFAAMPQNKNPVPQQQTVKAFKPFTGRVTANKVRMRAKADLDSHIVRQFSKNELLLVVGEEGEFFAVEPPKDTKAYVFRSYILDDVVEANKVNVRLEPNPEAPVIGQLEAGMKVQSQICANNHKWLEIPMPVNSKFYVSKEFVVQAGGPEYLGTMEKRKTQVEELYNSARSLALAEEQKSYEEMSIFTASDQFQTIIRGYTDFPDMLTAAKEALAHLKEVYLNKKIAYLEEKAELSPTAKEELIAKHNEETKEYFATEQAHPSFWSKKKPRNQMTDAKLWDTLEEALYLSWTSFHTGKKMDDFYAEQKANSTVLTGKLEPYTNPVKDKPGNYILKGSTGPIAYVYSTQVDLEKYADKEVTIVASPRPNNHFAFPAYFVMDVE